MNRRSGVLEEIGQDWLVAEPSIATIRSGGS
jgi:hypothetical protein